ncbi:MAG: thermonuclease family protein [Desulfovibrionaceae bacterium]|nr:thermonuclease family protein [Desulfovibrionaceae bacterium]
MRRTVAAWVCAALLLLAPPGLQARSGADASWTATVSYVVDGDSIWVKTADGNRRVRLRLEGIDAPEICQRFGPEARQAMQALALDQRVRVTVRARDRYGRAIAEVVRTRDGVDVAARMVSDGWAWSEGFRGRPGKYASEQAAARRLRRGLFADTAPQLPSDFRRRHGPCKAR